MPLRCARNMTMIQEHLKELYGPDSYYTRKYAGEELKYCGRVPYWLCPFLEQYLQDQGDQPRVLDIGPGYGLLACLSSQYGGNVTTLDRVPFISPEVRKAYGVRTIQGDIERATLVGVYDAIIMTEVLEHFNFNPRPTMKRIVRMLSPGGRIFLSTPDAATWGRIKTYEGVDAIPDFPAKGTFSYPEWFDGHVWQYNEAEIYALLADSGLDILEIAHSNSPGGNHFNLMLQKHQ